MVELNGTNQFLYAPNGHQQLASMAGQQIASAFVQLPGGAVAVYIGQSHLAQYNHSDWLGSAQLFSSPSRVASPAMAYAPFGEGYAGGINYVQFTGMGAWTVSDTENQSGSLIDFPFRRYSPVQGRWISPDPAGLGAANPANPQSWNRYAYVSNGPLNATDPLGLFNDAVSSQGDDGCIETSQCQIYIVNGMQVSSSVGQMILGFGGGAGQITLLTQPKPLGHRRLLPIYPATPLGAEAAQIFFILI